VHALDPLQLDVAGGGRPADPGEGAVGLRREAADGLRDYLDDLSGVDDAQVVVGHEGDGPAALIG